MARWCMLTGMEDHLLWGRQCGESRKAFAAFTTYVEMGTDRSLKRLSEALGRSTSRGLFARWSAKWSWQQRVKAFDREQGRVRQMVHAGVVKETIKRQQSLGKALLGQAGLALAAMRGPKCEECGRGGVNLTPTQITQFVKVGVDVERLALGLPTSGAPVAIAIAGATAGASAGIEAMPLLIRDHETQRLASELLSRMKAVKDHRRERMRMIDVEQVQTKALAFRVENPDLEGRTRRKEQQEAERKATA